MYQPRLYVNRLAVGVGLFFIGSLFSHPREQIGRGDEGLGVVPESFMAVYEMPYGIVHQLHKMWS